MKWIGQHIYDFVSRFRNEAIFEHYSHNTVGDSNRTTIINGDEIKLANSSNTSGPLIDIRNTADNNTGATVDYYNSRANPADGDVILLSRYIANNDNGDAYYVGQQLWRFEDVSDGAEKGFYGLSLAAHSSAGSSNFFEAEAKGSSDIDVKIGLGSSSTTTIRGDLTVAGGDISLSGTGRIQGIDTVTDATDAASKSYVDTAISGTVGSAVDLTSEVSGVLPVANGGTGASSLTDNKLLTGTGTSAVTAEANATYDGTDLTLTSATSTKPILSIENTTNDANSGELKLIGRRSADASIIAGAGDDAGTISFIGENAKSGPDPETIPYGKIASESYAVTDGAEMGKMTLSIGANLSAVGGSLGFQDVLSSYASVFGETTTFGSGGLMSSNTFDATITYFTSTVTTSPIFGVYNYTDDATGPQFTIGNLRGGIGGSKTDGSDNDSCGAISFKAYDDGTPTSTTFAKIEGVAKDVSDGAEEGKLTLSVASHDGEIQPGLTIESGDAEDEVDATIGNGSASVVTIPGFVSIGGHAINDIDIAGEFVDSDEHLMTAAAINDRIAAAGGSVSVSDSTANTDFPVVFHDESNNLHDDTATFTYNPSTGNAVIPKIQTAGNIELGHASDTTIARSAAGIVTVEGEEVVTTLTRSLTSGAAGKPLALMQARRTLTEAELNDLHNTPITIVAAQGANTVIVPMEAMMFVDRDASTAQSTGASLLFSWDGNSSYATDALLYMRRFMYNESGDRIMNVKGGYTGEVGTSLTAGTNKPVKAVFDLAITSGSLDSMDVYLTYYVLNIS